MLGREQTRHWENPMKISHVFIAELALFAGCLSDMGTDVSKQREMVVSKIESISIQGRTASFIVACYANTCEEFARTEHSISNHTVAVKIFSQDKFEGCAGFEATIHAPVSITVPFPGSYVFQFNRGYYGTLDTTLTFQ
jgi:hypothetical protein